MDEILLIDQSIDTQAKRLDELHLKLSFASIGEFMLSEDSIALCEAPYNKPGLYYFELANLDGISEPNIWLENFSPSWENRDFKWHSGLKKGRLKKHSSLKDWIPFYIGKSRFVGKRINEHILQPAEKTTFSMKLKSTVKLHGNKFRVSWLPVEVKHYDIIVPALERLMRDRFNPIVGKQ